MIITCPSCSTRYSLPQDKIKPGGQKVRCAKCGTVWQQAQEEVEPLAPPPEEQVPAPPVPPEPAWAPAVPAETPPPPMPANPPSDPAGESAVAPAGPLETTGTPETTESVADTEAAAVTRDPPPDNFAQFHRPSTADEGASGAGRKWAIAVIAVVILALAALVVFKQEVQDLTGIQLVSAPAPALPADPAPVPAAPVRTPAAPQPLTLTFEEVESSIEEIDGIRRLMVKGLIVNPADHEQTVPSLAFNMLDKDGKPIDRWTFTAPVRALAPHTTTRFSGQRDTPPTTLHELVPGFDVPENPPPVIEPPAAAGTAPGAPAKPAATPGAAATKPTATPQPQ